MARSLIILVVLLGLGGCARAPTLSAACASMVVPPAVTGELADRVSCAERAVGYERAAALGSVRQMGSQTRTVGVPRGFLVAMILLILLVGLA